MHISTQEAADALTDIAQVQQRASIQFGYQQGASQFFLWGLIWIVGYGVSDLWPSWAGAAWLVLDVVGLTVSYLLGCRVQSAAPHGQSDSAYGRRYLALCATILALVAATYFIMDPHRPAQFGAFPALLIAALYIGYGIWRGARWAVAGGVLGVCTVVGFAVFKEHFMLWMAVVGGGTLIVTGLWLRRA